jgi:hypothetical protein
MSAADFLYNLCVLSCVLELGVLLVKNSDIKAVLGDEIDGMEFELFLIWDAIKL